MTVAKLIAFEQGELDRDGVIDLFSTLVTSGLAWRLQGFYGRMANDLIASGLLAETGERIDIHTD